MFEVLQRLTCCDLLLKPMLDPSEWLKTGPAHRNRNSVNDDLKLVSSGDAAWLIEGFFYITIGLLSVFIACIIRHGSGRFPVGLLNGLH